MSLNLLSLETILKRAEKNHFDLEALPWAQGVDFSKHFFPAHLTPLYHTPSYAALSDAQRLTYNQLYGQAINEQFIFLEDRFLVQFIGGMRLHSRSDLPEELRTAMEGFVEEEVKHTEMFRRLARLTDPAIYNRSDYHFLRLGRAESALLGLMARKPDFFVFWCLLALAFEEKTVDYFRHYQRHAKEHPEQPLDTLYYEVHRFHMLDEVRHVQIDHHLVKHFYERCGSLLRTLNVKLMARTLRAYVRPKRTNMRIIEELGRRHPELAGQVPTMCEQIRALAWSRSWQEISYSRRNVPQTFAMFDAYPELHALSQDLLCYEPLGA